MRKYKVSYILVDDTDEEECSLEEIENYLKMDLQGGFRVEGEIKIEKEKE